VAGREQRTGAAEDDDAHLVVGLGFEERVVEVDQETAALALRLSGRFNMIRAIVPSSNVS